jgi:hypothetical protein
LIEIWSFVWFKSHLFSRLKSSVHCWPEAAQPAHTTQNKLNECRSTTHTLLCLLSLSWQTSAHSAIISSINYESLTTTSKRAPVATIERCQLIAVSLLWSRFHCRIVALLTCKKTHDLFFEFFPYICPEPVLVK